MGHSDASILGLLWNEYIFFLTLNFLVTQSCHPSFSLLSIGELELNNWQVEVKEVGDIGQVGRSWIQRDIYSIYWETPFSSFYLKKLYIHYRYQRFCSRKPSQQQRQHWRKWMLIRFIMEIISFTLLVFWTVVFVAHHPVRTLSFLLECVSETLKRDLTISYLW